MNFSDHGHARTKHLGVEFCFQSRSCAVCSAESPNILPSKRQKAHVLGNQHRCLCATSASSLWKTQQQLLPTLQMPSATTGTTSSATRESPVVCMRNDTGEKPWTARAKQKASVEGHHQLCLGNMQVGSNQLWGCSLPSLSPCSGAELRVQPGSECAS